MHKHIAINADIATARPYFGRARGTRRENPAAHGGVSYVYRCACGAEQVVNVNGRAIERGAWIDDAAMRDA